MIPNVGLQASQRDLAQAVNYILNKRLYPFQPLASAPASPKEGCTYYNTTTHKVMTYDGTLWQAHW